jgi:hypothetical protein
LIGTQDQYPCNWSPTRDTAQQIQAGGVGPMACFTDPWLSSKDGDTELPFAGCFELRPQGFQFALTARNLGGSYVL